MPIVTFDTNIFIAHKPSKFPQGFRLTAVVLQELTVGAADKNEVKYWNDYRRAMEKEGKMLVPTSEDWWEAGKVLNSLLRGLKSDSEGKTPKLSPDEKQRIIRDVLIARTAKRENALLVTDNLKDFEVIRRFCKVKVKSWDDFNK